MRVVDTSVFPFDFAAHVSDLVLYSGDVVTNLVYCSACFSYFWSGGTSVVDYTRGIIHGSEQWGTLDYILYFVAFNNDDDDNSRIAVRQYVAVIVYNLCIIP